VTAAVYHAPVALLPQGWRESVRLAVDAAGDLSAVAPGVAPGNDDTRLPGPVIPGLPNLHSHAFQRLLAGRTQQALAGDDSFWSWREAMYAQAEAMTPALLEAVSALLYVELLEHGYTAVAEFHYLHHSGDGRRWDDPAAAGRALLAAARASGIGLTVLPVFYAHAGFGGTAAEPRQAPFVHDLDGYTELLGALESELGPGTVLGCAAHSLRAVTPEELAGLAGLRPDAPLHIHIAEQAGEVEACRTWSGRRPVAWLLEHQPPDRRWCLVHATHVEPQEWRGIAESGAVVGLCPGTEADLGDGIFPLPDYAAAGGRFGIGSDSQATIDPHGELRLLEQQHRLLQRRRNVLNAGAGSHTGTWLYQQAAAGGARALGRRAGALEPGYRADLVVLDASHPLAERLEVAQLLDATILADGLLSVAEVYVAGRRQVAAGRHIRRDALADKLRRALP